MNSPPKAKRPGLCKTCKNAAFCVYRSQRGFDALYCEMFENKPDTDRHYGTDPIITEVSRYSKKMEQRLCKGLCTNCDNFENCQLPKPEEGVWHCEEYI